MNKGKMTKFQYGLIVLLVLLINNVLAEESSNKEIIGNNTDVQETNHHYVSLDPLYFPFVGLLCGAMVLYLQKRFLFFVPYTCLMFLLGVVFGLIHGAGADMGDFSGSIEQWINIDPHLLLTVFLPALIFSDAMKMNIHLFRVCFWQCFLLAGPGVFVSATAMGFVALFLLTGFGYHFDFNLAVVFGAILSATDPVSVVAMLESVSAPPKLTMIMSGESHLADLTVSLFLC